ncbi:hypothetical protein R1flu_018932 [Riccia fluitans]|uniref:Uncharacterized protein n=1 Tax=Riccia fluitans TaxID=41844 RepID=A0ABD1ZH88_9MARC
MDHRKRRGSNAFAHKAEVEAKIDHIDNLVSNLEEEEGKCKPKVKQAKADDGSGTSRMVVDQSTDRLIAQYRQPRGLTTMGGDQRPVVNFVELSLMTRIEVFPFLNITSLKSSGKLVVDGKMFSRRNDSG